MGNHLSVSVGLEDVAFGLQALPQFAIVFDDAVLHHGNAASHIPVGVGVVFFRLAVGGPAGMANA